MSGVWALTSSLPTWTKLNMGRDRGLMTLQVDAGVEVRLVKCYVNGGDDNIVVSIYINIHIKKNNKYMKKKTFNQRTKIFVLQSNE